MNDSSTEKSEQNLEYEQDGVEEEEEEVHEKQISVQFVSENGEAPFPPFEVPRDITPAKLLLIITKKCCDSRGLLLCLLPGALLDLKHLTVLATAPT